MAGAKKEAKPFEPGLMPLSVTVLGGAAFPAEALLKEATRDAAI